MFTLEWEGNMLRVPHIADTPCNIPATPLCFTRADVDAARVDSAAFARSAAAKLAYTNCNNEKAAALDAAQTTCENEKAVALDAAQTTCENEKADITQNALAAQTTCENEKADITANALAEATSSALAAAVRADPT